MKESHSFPLRRWCFNIFFQILGNMIKVSRPSLFVEPTLCSAESQKNYVWWRRKNWKKEFDNILYQIACNLRRSFVGCFRVRTLQRITCVEKENKPSSLMAIMKEERKEEKLKSRGKKLRVPRPCPSIIQWRMVLVTGKICDDMFETLMCISNAHYTTKFPSIIQWRM